MPGAGDLVLLLRLECLLKRSVDGREVALRGAEQDVGLVHLVDSTTGRHFAPRAVGWPGVRALRAITGTRRSEGEEEPRCSDRLGQSDDRGEIAKPVYLAVA